MANLIDILPFFPVIKQMKGFLGILFVPSMIQAYGKTRIGHGRNNQGFFESALVKGVGRSKERTFVLNVLGSGAKGPRHGERKEE